MTESRAREWCAVEGCSGRPRRFSRYCATHYGRSVATGSPGGRIVRKGTLKPYVREAARFIERHAEHPATQAALTWCGTLLEPQGETAGFLRGEFRRLREGGATAEGLLAGALGFAFWEAWQVRPMLDGRCADTNLGRAMLRVIPARRITSRTGKRYSVRVSSSHAAALGEHTRAEVGLFLVMAARELVKESERPEQTRQEIRRALEAEPFTAATS